MVLQCSSILRARDILNRGRSKFRYNHTFSKPYNPYCLAQQFCLVQGIPLLCKSYAKFDKQANIFANELADLELSSNEKMNNFHFEKFKIAPLATLEFASW